MAPEYATTSAEKASPLLQTLVSPSEIGSRKLLLAAPTAGLRALLWVLEAPTIHPNLSTHLTER